MRGGPDEDSASAGGTGYDRGWRPVEGRGGEGRGGASSPPVYTCDRTGGLQISFSQSTAEVKANAPTKAKPPQLCKMDRGLYRITHLMT